MDRADIDAILELTTSHCLMYGPRGTSKTTDAVESARSGQTVFQVTFTADAGDAQYLGHFVPEGMKFVWHKGAFQRAWEEGALLVINEVDHASESVSNLLHAILDDGLGAYVTLPTGDTIHPAPGFRCIATMNGVPSDLEPAVLDRFRVRLPVMMPSAGQLASLPPEIALTCVSLYEKGQAEKTTFRMLAAFVKARAELAVRYDPDKAEKLAAASIYGNVQEGEALLRTIQLNKATLTHGGAR